MKLNLTNYDREIIGRITQRFLDKGILDSISSVSLVMDLEDGLMKKGAHERDRACKIVQKHNLPEGAEIIKEILED